MEETMSFYECDRKTASEQLVNVIKNVVPQKWESQMTQAARTTEPDPDTFCLNPHRAGPSPLVCALAIAPSEPFKPPPTSSLDPVPLPEITEPYFPPDHPIIPIKKKEEVKMEEKLPIPKPYSPFVKALEITPERERPVVAQVKKKPKDPLDELLGELPRPSEKLDMRSALMIAPDRCYTPLINEYYSSASEETHEVKATKIQKQEASFQTKKQDAKPPSYYSPAVIEERIKSESFQATQNESTVKEASVTTVEAAQNEIVRNETVSETHNELIGKEAPVGNFAPIFQGFSCSFKNKTDHSQFSVEVSTTPPVPTLQVPTPQVPPPQTPINYIATVKERPAARIVQEQHQETKTVQKQAEEVVQVKTSHVSLKKPETLPGYQQDLRAAAEADLILMERKKRAEERLEQQKREREQQKPIIKIEPDEIPQKTISQPILEDNLGSRTFSSPRPRSITPSMVHKAPALLPYYQDNLVPHFHAPLATNLFDPTHPEISRSPSPHFGKAPKCNSPLPPEIQAKSPLLTQQNAKIELAKESLKNYIPEYKSQMDFGRTDIQKNHSELAEKSHQELLEASRQFETRSTEMLAGRVQGPHLPEIEGKTQMDQNVATKQQISDIQKNQSEFTAGGSIRKDIEENSHQELLEASRQSQTRSTEMLAGGVQVQRRKMVTEEFEKCHKEQNVKIETRAFERANVANLETTTLQSFHITDPHHFKAQSACQLTGACQKEQQSTCQLTNKSSAACQLTETCQKEPRQAPTPPIPPIRSFNNKQILSCRKPSDNVTPPKPDLGAGAGRQTAGITAAPKRGRGLLNAAALPGGRVALCGQCHGQIRGPFITALGKIWCPHHFVCATPSCKRPLQDLGFVEERGQLYCEYCFEQYLAPNCSKCNGKIKGECLKAIGKNFHPECFNCVYCGKLFGNNPFFLEDGNPYCDADWNELFTTKCFACGFPVEAGDRWVEALNNNYHSQCFNCTMCKKNLEGQSFFAKGGRPFCRNHAR